MRGPTVIEQSQGQTTWFLARAHDCVTLIVMTCSRFVYLMLLEGSGMGAVH